MTSLTMAEGCRIASLSTPLFVTKPSVHSFVSLPFKPILFNRLPSPLSVSLSLPKLPLLVPRVAQKTSDWTQVEDGEDGEEAVGLSELEGEGDEVLQDGEETYEEPPEEAKLFVGNLSFDMDSESLAKLFDQAGVVEISEVIYDRNTDQSRGFGFVTMRTVEEAEKAVKLFNRYDCNGRLLTVNKAAPRGSTPERPREFAPSLRIYVGNLPWQVDDSRLEQLFSEHGEVVDARVVYDRESGRSRGFGFVTMSSKAGLDDAIAALDGKSLDGRAIRVNVAEERPRRGSF